MSEVDGINKLNETDEVNNVVNEFNEIKKEKGKALSRALGFCLQLFTVFPGSPRFLGLSRTVLDLPDRKKDLRIFRTAAWAVRPGKRQTLVISITCIWQLSS